MERGRKMKDVPPEADLSDTVALVTGASRGVGRGIAHELGLAGATVWVTGRSREGGATTDDLPGTVDGTAQLVTEAGGRGLAVPCDHADDGQVEALAERIREENGRLDLLVNNVWGGYEAYDHRHWTQAPWEQPIWRFDRMWQIGVRAHYVTTRAVAPLLLDADDPLIVEISFGDDGAYLDDVQYDVTKAACNRLAFALARELGPQAVTSLAVWPGFTRTERVARHAPEETLETSDSPRFVGRCVVALAADPDVAERAGGAYRAGRLGLDYGFTDIDGRQPEPYRLPEADAG